MKVLSLPLLLSRVAAGFPSPAEDYVEQFLDLNDHLITHPAATFFVRAVGYSMADAGIHPGDLLVVDRSAQVLDGDVAVCRLDGEFTVKRFRRRRDGIVLEPANGAHQSIAVSPHAEFEIWGKVTYVIHEP